MRKALAALAAAALAAAVTACSGGAAAPASLPACSTGHGSDGSHSVLAIQQNGDAFTGVYVNTSAATDGVGLRYDVTGHVHGDRLSSSWDLGSFVVSATGRFTAREIVLDNPGGKFSTTVFHAAKPAVCADVPGVAA